MEKNQLIQKLVLWKDQQNYQTFIARLTKIKGVQLSSVAQPCPAISHPMERILQLLESEMKEGRELPTLQK